MSIISGPNIANDGLVLHFDAANTNCYSGTGSTWTDLSRNGNGGNINIATYDSVSKSFNFSGNDANYISSAYNGQVTDFTLEVWFKDDGVQRAYERLVDKYYVSGFWLGRESSNGHTWGGGVIEPNPPYGIFLTLTDGYWHKITSIRSGNQHILYGDGITNTISNTVPTTPLDSNILVIGNWYSLNYSQSYNGNIAIVKWYNRALSSSEVLQNYNATKHRFGLT
jgi:hypothetical protein